MRNRKFHILFALYLLISSCSIFGDDGESPAGEKGIYGGIFSQGIEDSNFEPCYNRDENWKLVSIEDTNFYSKFQKVGENPVYMELKGTPSKKGEYRGFFMTYNREFSVEKVVKAASPAAVEC